ncbi:hypothetical protein BDZ91DRAFT_176300 [Kalaharituber pfeilii]|nr:hypothetical protein BDZ91DRAFT_176300 [Kalaharituber pfeilii]
MCSSASFCSHLPFLLSHIFVCRLSIWPPLCCSFFLRLGFQEVNVWAGNMGLGASGLDRELELTGCNWAFCWLFVLDY